MTTPQDIQAALDDLNKLRKEHGHYYLHAEHAMAEYLLEHDETILSVLQSHAPEAIPVDADALKKGNHNVNNPLYRDYNIGWNACIDYLLRRGFRQGGGS